jgi:peptide deformylase
MAFLKIVLEGDELLRKKSRPVEEITPRILQLLDDMKATLKKAEGAGLAAVQVGVLRRMVVIDAGDGPVELINPEIVSVEGTREVREGCLSCPGKWVVKNRPQKVVARALDRKGRLMEYKAEGLFAQALCHETEHLDGILLTDKMIRYLTDEEMGN